ncbi:hypothetical protein SDJN03_09397, partial [Cucurbita argyrosperma subsp. sororia]
MENEHESASSSALAWRWTVEALASFKEVKHSLLRDVIDEGKELPEVTRKNAGEMIALRCLEGLFGPLNYSGENGPPAEQSKVMFDSSECCEDVLKRVCKETSKSALRVAEPDMSKWDVSPFIAQKRASMRCTLLQLQDSILDGTHPYADFLMQKSGLMPVKKQDRIFLNNGDLNKRCRRLDTSSSDPQAQKEKSRGSPVLLEEERRRLSVADPSTSSLLPSKRSIVDLTSEDEARQLLGCNDGYVNAKRRKVLDAHTSHSGHEVASSHGAEVFEASPEIVVPQERDDIDHQMTSVEDKVVEEEYFGSKKSGQYTATDELHQVESSTPCYTTLRPSLDVEMDEVISLEKSKDGNELPVEQKASNNSPVEGNRHDIITGDSEHDFGVDNHVNEMNTLSHCGFLPKTVDTDIDVGMNPDEEEKDMLSDSDGYHNRTIAAKKKEFISSQCMADRDSFLLAEGSVCVKCNEGGQLLSCNGSGCPLVVHDKCLDSSARMHGEGGFSCPFCLCSLAISEYLEAKKNAALAKKNIATFFRTCLGHHSIVIQEALQQKDLDPSRNARVEDAAKISEQHLENQDNQVTLDGEHVKEAVNHQSATVTDIEGRIELSKPLHIPNSNHRENEASSSRVAPDVLSGEKDGDELVNQECLGDVAELKDGLEATEQHDIYDTLHEDQGPVEAAAMQEGLQYQTDDKEEEPSYAINIGGEKYSDDDDNDQSIISRYSIRFRRKYHQLVSSYFCSS